MSETAQCESIDTNEASGSGLLLNPAVLDFGDADVAVNAARTEG